MIPKDEVLFYLWSLGTWLRVSVWLVIGILIYIFYRNAHSNAGEEQAVHDYMLVNN
jgi:C-terminus of AA_permease